MRERREDKREEVTSERGKSVTKRRVLFVWFVLYLGFYLV